MSKTLLILVIAMLLLCWKFVFFPEKLDFSDKMKVLQGLTLAAPYKEAVADYYKTHGHFPDAEQWRSSTSRPEFKLAADSRSAVGNIKVAETRPGVVTVYYSNIRDQSLAADIAGKSLTLLPYLHKGVLDWSCQGNVPADYLPAACR